MSTRFGRVLPIALLAAALLGACATPTPSTTAYAKLSCNDATARISELLSPISTAFQQRGGTEVGRQMLGALDYEVMLRRFGEVEARSEEAASVNEGLRRFLEAATSTASYLQLWDDSGLDGDLEGATQSWHEANQLGLTGICNG